MAVRERLRCVEAGVWETHDGELRALQQPNDGTPMAGLWQWFTLLPTHDLRGLPDGRVAWTALYVDEFYETLREAREALPRMRRALAEDQTDEQVAGYLVGAGYGIGLAVGHAMLRGGLAHFDENESIVKVSELADELEIAGDRPAAQAIRHEVARARGLLSPAVDGRAIEGVAAELGAAR